MQAAKNSITGFMGRPFEDYQMFFSGSPAVYPPLGALANDIGGLTRRRSTLGLCFILGIDYAAVPDAQRLAGRKAGSSAAALVRRARHHAVPVGFATYDPMALFLRGAGGSTWRSGGVTPTGR